MSRKEVADYEREIKLKNQQESLTDSDETLVRNFNEHSDDPLKYNGFTHASSP